jgi:hypothetical protein
MFIFTLVPLVCTDDDYLEDTDFADVLIFLANAAYWMYYGRQSAVTRSKAKENVEKFAEAYKKYFDNLAYTWKFHYFTSHMIKMLEVFGSAYNFDNVNLEKTIGVIKRTRTSTKNADEEVAINFLIRYHCHSLSQMEKFEPEIVKVLTKMNADKLASPRLGIFCLNDVSKNIPVPDSEANEVKNLLLGVEGSEITETILYVDRIQFGPVKISSSRFPHAHGVNDSFVQVNGEVLGRVKELYEFIVEGKKLYACCIQKYERLTTVLDSDGFRATFPDFGFPVVSTNELVYIYLRPGLFVQKVMSAQHVFHPRRSPQTLMFFSILPHEWICY